MLALGSGEREERSALERLVRALRESVDHRPLWTELEGFACGANSVNARASAEAFLTMISTALGDAHADLLDRCGYRVPPPPPAERLVEQTRRSVLWGDRRPRWGRRHVQEAHGELDTFVSRLETALSEGVGLRRRLFRARNVGICTILVGLASIVELKSGNDVSVEVSLSLKDKVKIEVTLPVPWMESEENVGQARAVIANSQSSNLGETIAMMNIDGGVWDYAAIPPEWRAVWVRRWYVERDPTAEAVRLAEESVRDFVASQERAQRSADEDSGHRDDGDADGDGR